MGEKKPEQNVTFSRLRRLRSSELIRQAVADVRLSPAMLIYPVFVTDRSESHEVIAMPGVIQWPVEQAAARISELHGRGLKQFILFGVIEPDKKDPAGSYVRSPDSPVNRLIRHIREHGPEVLLYADLCLCEYTDHGHCGILDAHYAGGPDYSRVVDNDRTVDALAETAVVQAASGVDVVAPSAMMDGQVAVIRSALDDAGYRHVAILSYSVKYASHLYGPFREAGEGGMRFGDRRGYQMDYRRSREWQCELVADIREGADMVMIKPAVACLDIIYRVRQACSLPVLAYHVSGEYAMLHAAARAGWLDLKEAALEQTYAIRRAGADMIITYFAPDLIDWLT